MSESPAPAAIADLAAPPPAPALVQPVWRARLVPIALVAISVALLVPHAFSSRWFRKDKQVGLPRVFSGDEPHYLILLNSLVRDGDLDVMNDYADVHRGGNEAGETFRGSALDHHTAWVADGKHVRWNEVFEMNGSHWGRDARGHPVPKLLANAPPGVAPVHEFSYHWPGLALLQAALLFPLAGSTYLEPAAIFCTWIATVLAMLAFVSLARSLGASDLSIVIATLLTFLATPLWHYDRTLFTEPYALTCILGAHALYARNRRVFLAGVLCGIGMLLKNAFVVMALPLGIAMLVRKQWKDALLFAAPQAAAVLATLWLNHAMHGSYLHGPQVWYPGDFTTGAIGLWFSTDHGILPYAPVVLCALVGWPALAREHRGIALLAAASFLAQFIISASYLLWHGGYCYGPRYLIPVFPFLMLGLLMRLRQRPLRLWQWADVAVLGALSLWINFRGAVPYWNYWSVHPLARLFG